jgi:hypothetical protein
MWMAYAPYRVSYIWTPFELLPECQAANQKLIPTGHFKYFFMASCSVVELIIAVCTSLAAMGKRTKLLHKQEQQLLYNHSMKSLAVTCIVHSFSVSRSWYHFCNVIPCK